jgi:hypothetical protein
MAAAAPFFGVEFSLVTDAGRPVFLILDNSQVHRAVILKEFGIVRVFEL